MSQNFRQPDILEIARTEGKVTVDGLAARFGVTVQTIRRDLSDLAQTGRLERVHGGAILPSGVSNIGYEERRRLNADAKSRMALACARAIPNEASVFLNIGTSTEAVARALLNHSNLMVVTNNLNVANILAANPDCEIIVAGGNLRRSDGGLTGHVTTRTIEMFRFDFGVIGCSALDLQGDILDFDVEEVGVSQTIIAQSRKVFAVADHAKFQRQAPARIGSLSAVDTLFTDRAPPLDVARKCQEWNTQISLS